MARISSSSISFSDDDSSDRVWAIRLRWREEEGGVCDDGEGVGKAACDVVDPEDSDSVDRIEVPTMKVFRICIYVGKMK